MKLFACNLSPNNKNTEETLNCFTWMYLKLFKLNIYSRTINYSHWLDEFYIFHKNMKFRYIIESISCSQLHDILGVDVSDKKRDVK